MSARFGLVFVALAIAFAAPASAQPKPPPTVTCDFLEVTATNGAKPSIDPELEKLKKKFKKPPFSSWNQFKLAMKESRTLTAKKADKLKLKHGQATATLLGIVNNAQVRMTIAIDDDKGKNVVNNTSTVAAGDYLVFGRSLANNDGHLLALTCK